VSSDGDFIYEYGNKITKVNASSGEAVAAIQLGNSNIFNSLAISRDNKYLLYSTGSLVTGDAVDIDGLTTLGMLKTSDLSAVATPIVLTFNDNNLTVSHFMIDKIVLFQD